MIVAQFLLEVKFKLYQIVILFTFSAYYLNK